VGAEFCTVLVEGIFYRDGADRLMVDQSGTSVAVADELRPLDGQEILLALHYFPLTFDPTLWGGGSCQYQSAGRCPAGHHQEPGKMLSVTLRGVLRYEDEGWGVTAADGTRTFVPFEHAIGHRSRLVAISAFNPLLADATPRSPADIERLRAEATRLRDFLTQFQQHARKV